MCVIQEASGGCSKFFFFMTTLFNSLYLMHNSYFYHPFLHIKLVRSLWLNTEFNECLLKQFRNCTLSSWNLVVSIRYDVLGIGVIFRTSNPLPSKHPAFMLPFLFLFISFFYMIYERYRIYANHLFFLQNYYISVFT